MPTGLMLQIVVDNADEWAERPRGNAVKVDGPVSAHGECIHFLNAPGGSAVTLQSRLVEVQYEGAR
jgi:hypothetical protein